MYFNDGEYLLADKGECLVEPVLIDHHSLV